MNIDIKAYFKKRGFKVLEVKQIDNDYAVWIDGRKKSAEEAMKVLETAHPQFDIEITETRESKILTVLLFPYCKVKSLFHKEKK